MNRGTVVFLALAVFLAHTLAIHQSPDGEFALPYEIAHVAYRLGRNLVYDGTALWNPGGVPADSYPSVLWVLVSAFAARIYFAPTFLTQGLGFAAALVSIFVLAQFSPRRSAGLIAPLLVAASGSAAAAAASGTEAAAAMLLATTSFYAFERGHARLLMLSLIGLVLTRPEGVGLLVALLGLEVVGRPRIGFSRRPRRLAPYAAALLVVLAAGLTRHHYTGHWASPFASQLLDRERWTLGLAYAWSFVRASGFGLLVLLVPPSLLAGRTSAMGMRALLLALSWIVPVIASGGDGLPFWNALVPVLPLLFLGIQDCLRDWMDTTPRCAPVVWGLLAITVMASFLVSKVPGDLGPLRLKRPLTDWETPRGALAEAYPRPLGRLGLLDEIRSVEHLRTLGVFLRDRVSEDATIQTFWPGAIGYLSRREVLDLVGRACPLPGMNQTLSWRGPPRVDLPAVVTAGAEYMVPLIGSMPEGFSPSDLLHDWLARWDIVGPTEERTRVLQAALRGYELVAAPVPAKSRRPGEPSEQPFPLLRRKDLGLAPELEIVPGEERFAVMALHAGHQQVVDLCVRHVDGQGHEMFLAPTGIWTDEGSVAVRTSILLFPTGAQRIELVSAGLPPGTSEGTVTAWLHNPGMRADAVLSAVSPRVQWTR
jgi:hypothetical protein